MGAFDGASQGLGNAYGGFFGGVGSGLFGNGQSPGILGTGQYQSNPYNINPAAYNNPVGNQAPAWQAGMNNFLAATTPGSAAPNLTNYNQAYGQGQQLYGQLGQIASGQGPSVAALQAQQTGQQNLQNQLSALGSAQGGAGNPALASYNAGQVGAQNAAQTQQAAVMGRTQEQLGALNQMGALNNQLQQGGLQSANLGMQNNQFNAANTSQQYNQYQQMLQAQALAQYQAQMQQQQLGSQTQGQNNQTQSQAYNNSATNITNLAGGLLGGVGALLGL